MSFSNRKHVVIDLEALGGIGDADAIITAISAVVVSGRSTEDYKTLLGRTQLWKLSIADQESVRSQDPETVKWWEGQKEEVKVQCFYPDLNKDLSARDALLKLNQYLVQSGVNDSTMVWSRGTAYDIPKLLNLYAQCGLKPAFNSWNIADTKTAFLVRSVGATNQFGLGGNPQGFQKHNALHDTALEAFKLTKFFAELDLKVPYKPVKASSGVVECLEGASYELFSGFVCGLILKGGKVFTKTVNDAWAELQEDSVKAIIIRNTLYKMQKDGLIKSVKDGVYSHWERV
jgi:hypothetical protein